MRQASNELNVEIEKKPQKKLSFYFKTGLAAIGFGIFTFVITMSFGDIGEFISIEWVNWFLPCIAIPGFIGAHISGATYLGREADLLSNKKTRFSNEQWGTVLGITFGLVVAVTVIILSTGLIAATAASLLTGDISGMLNILEMLSIVIGSVGSFGGFGNRLGSAIQSSHGEGFYERLSSVIVKEKKPILVGALMGFTFSLTTWLLGAVALTSIVGLNIVTAGLPLWIMGGLFVLSYTSSYASSFDYFARAHTYIRATYYNDEKAQKTMEGKKHQFRGAAVGVAIGAVIALAIIITLFVTQPYLIAAIAAAGVFFVCTGTWGGICSRFGRILFDEPALAEPEQSKAESKEVPVSTPKPAPVRVQEPLVEKQKPIVIPAAGASIEIKREIFVPELELEPEFLREVKPLRRSRSSTINMISALSMQDGVVENTEFLPANKKRDDDSISALLKDNGNLSLINSCGFEDINKQMNNLEIDERIALEA